MLSCWETNLVSWDTSQLCQLGSSSLEVLIGLQSTVLSVTTLHVPLVAFPVIGCDIPQQISPQLFKHVLSDASHYLL